MSLRAPENDATCSAVAPHSTALARRIAETAAALNQAVAGQVRRRGRPRVADLRLRFESKISPCPVTGCWWWSGNGSGGRHQEYGRFGIDAATSISAHRFSYELYVGQIPDGLDVLHRCDQPSCVNPAHLWVGTHLDNMRDMVSKGRKKPRNSRPETAMEAICEALGVASNAEAVKAVQWLVEFRRVALKRMDVASGNEPRPPAAIERLVFSLGPA